MPFNPDEYLAKKQEVTAGPATGQAKAFDPDAYLATQGVDVGTPKLPAEAPSTLSAIGHGLAQGATSGFGDELSAAAGAVLPTATDNALGRGYTDRYASIRDSLRAENLKAAEAHPVISALSEIAGSLPLAIASGGLANLGTIKTAAVLGGIYGLGKSNKDSVMQAAEDAGKSALLSAGFAKALQVGGALLSKGSGPVAELAGSPGNFEIKYGAGLKDSFKLGQQMEEAIATPETQQVISRELNDQQGNIAKTIQTVKQNIGQKWAPLIEQHGDTPTNLKDAFSNIYSKLSKIVPEGDDVAAKVQDALSARVKGIEEQLMSHTGSLENVPLKAVADAQEALGNIVFEQGAYRKVPAVNGAAKNFFGKLASAFEKADTEAGSGGDLTNINKMYSALYKMQENKLTGAAISKLASDPQSTAALKAYDSFIKPFADIEPGVRSSLAPELDNYISNDFQKALVKAQLMKKITGRGPSTTNEGIVGWALKKAYLGKGTLDNLANRAGALSSAIQDSSVAPKIAGALNSMSPAAPALGALSTVK